MKERPHRLLTLVRTALLAGLVALLTGHKYRRFRTTCEGVRSGESIDVVRKRLEFAGGLHWHAYNVHRWQRAKGLTFKVGVCTVEIDDAGLVKNCRFDEVDDLL